MGAVDKVTSRLERHGYLLYIKTPMVSIGIRGLHVTDNPQVDVCDSYHLMINLFCVCVNIHFAKSSYNGTFGTTLMSTRCACQTFKLREAILRLLGGEIKSSVQWNIRYQSKYGMLPDTLAFFPSFIPLIKEGLG